MEQFQKILKIRIDRKNFRIEIGKGKDTELFFNSILSLN